MAPNQALEAQMAPNQCQMAPNHKIGAFQKCDNVGLERGASQKCDNVGLERGTSQKGDNVGLERRSKPTLSHFGEPR